MNRMKKTAAVTAMVISASTVLAAVPAVAAPATVQSRQATVSSPSTSVALVGIGGFTSTEWLKIARSAERAGDKVSTQAARQAASAASSTSRAGGGQARPTNIFTSVAKKALVAALRYGGQKLPASMRPYANKLANVIDDVTEFQEGALISAFQAVGIPYDVASAAATWCVVFLGF